VTVPLDCATETILELVTEFLQHHNGAAPPAIDKPIRYKTMAENCKDPWDATYIDKVTAMGKQTLYDLATCANVMAIDSLMYLACAKIACILKGVPLNKIKETLDPKSEGKAEKKEA
jgi:hypothetical protein